METALNRNLLFCTKMKEFVAYYFSETNLGFSNKKNIFERFKTKKKSYYGLGLLFILLVCIWAYRRNNKQITLKTSLIAHIHLEMQKLPPSSFNSESWELRLVHSRLGLTILQTNMFLTY